MKWIYSYTCDVRTRDVNTGEILTHSEVIDMGLYDSQGEAQKVSDKHAYFGVKTSGAVEVPDDYKLRKGRS